MTEKELQFVLSEGEGPFVEFKEKVGKTLVREIVAFANAAGGRILLGVSDDSTAVGIDVDNRLKSSVQDMARNCDPSVIVELKTVGNILVVEVPEGINKPHACSDGFYIRIGANSQKLGRDEIFAMGIKSGRLRFDEQICAGFNLSSDLDESKLQAYLDVAGLNKDLPVLDILINLDVVHIENEHPVMTNAGALLFAKDPRKFLKSAAVVCALYQGNEKVQILDRKIYNDGLIDNIEQALTYVKRHMDVRFEITSLKRKEIPQYPEEALREAIVNAVMHRDYFDASGDIMVEVFKTRVIISNPGGLVSWLNPDDFGKYSRSRNNLIASMLMRTPYVEKMGTGILRINRDLFDAGLPDAEFDYDEYNFSATLHSQELGLDDAGPKSSPIDSVKSSQKILDAVADDPQVTIAQLAELCGISTRAVQKNIEVLKNRGLLLRIGPDRGGCWQAVGRQNQGS